MSNIIIGHEWVINQLQQALLHNRLRHAYLFTGTESIGKTTLARWLARAVNCMQPVDSLPCGECRACRLIATDRHPDVQIVESEQIGATLKIDRIREIQHQLALRPYEAYYKVIIIRRFHEAQPQAQDALLKTLEEPSEHAILLLTATSTAPVLSTITSRSQIFNMQPLPLATIHQALTDYLAVEDSDAQVLAHLSSGRIGWAIRAASSMDTENETALTQRDQHIHTLENSLTYQHVDRFKLAEELNSAARKDLNLLTMLEYWQTYWRDVVLLASHSQAPLTNIDRQTEIQQIAQSSGLDKALQALKATRRTIDYLQRNANTRLALEVLLLDYPYL